MADYDSTENFQANLPTEMEVEQSAQRTSNKTFGIIKVAGIETKKILFLCLISFLICFVYSIMKELKDAFVIVRQTPASINILKLFYVPPVAIIGALLVQKMLVSSDNKTILKRMLMFFAAIFILFTILSLPFVNLDFSGQSTKDMLSDGKMKFKGTESVVAAVYTVISWTSTLCFVSAEIYGSLVMSLLLFSFLNDICPIKQFLRFLPLILIFANVSLICSAGSLYVLKTLINNLSFRNKQYLYSGLFLILALVCMLTWLVITILDNVVLSKPMFIIENPVKKKKKGSVAYGEGFKTMFSSKFLLAMCITVLFYNLSQNMADSSYKSLMLIQKNLKNMDESYIMKNQCISQIVTALCVITLLITPFSRIVQLTGWVVSGMITPIYIAVIGITAFFLALYNTGSVGKNAFGFINTFIQAHPFLHKMKKSTDKYALFDNEEFLGMIFISGGYKVMKYASFDICKEAISMRIDPQYRSQFKGIYDGMCGKMGKMLGSIIGFIITILFNTQDVREASFVYLIISMIFAVIWIITIIYLGRKYNDSVAKNKFVDIDIIGEKDPKKLNL
ncbi:ADP/ATP carrier protein [Spraguea lophii 42_110]|uniref:ADP,ATP carrier protein n=1 Tax=Spraguea lophii (strain 42_110) TaxID=1358809 RepID=S7XUY2_SPRLO|nr:ADP/ATP carrier protein [Spraguea lophii 42_110]